MLKVLICDDELNICHLIVRLIHWEELEMELVGTVQNGRDALELITMHRPDIVLTDVRMPVYNGIELAGKAKQLGIASRFIVISGYSNFSYAQDALKVSVSDYLLKPINAQELNDVLSRVAGQIREDRKQQDLMDSIAGRLRHMTDVERGVFIKNVILGNSASYSPEMLRDCGFNFTGGSYLCFLSAFDLESEDRSARLVLEQQLSNIKEKLRIGDYPSLRELIMQEEGNCLYGFLNFAENQRIVVSSYLEDFYYVFRRAGAVLPDLHVTLAVGKTVSSPSELSDSVQNAREALRCRANLGTDRILIYDELPAELLERPRLSSAMTSRIRSSLDLCDLEAITTIMQGLFAEGNKQSHYRLAHELLSFVQKEQTANHPDTDYLVDEPALYEKTCAALETAFTPEQLSRHLIRYCQHTFETVDRRGVTQTDQSIELAKKYIAENFGGECSLQDIASYAHLSANYLSSTFKKKTGISMNTYITITRINEAKRLLKDTEEGIYDIGEQVGYRDPKHFRKVFKENVGISPAKYRSLYR